MKRILQARNHRVLSLDAAHRACRVPWWLASEPNVAIVESARCIGLAMLPPGRYHPFQLDTRGLAAVLKAVARRQVRTCLVGIGGSATNDGGFGLALGLGWRFLDSRDHPIQRWIDLHRLVTLIPPPRYAAFKPMRLVVATDVGNPLLGPQGATRVYGPQKGVRPADIAPAERALRRLSTVVEQTLGRALANQPGAGAAGGLGFGLLAFADAALQSGFDLYARHAHLGAHLRWAELLITGEGRIDASTLMGKGVGEIARRARSRHTACIGVAGALRDVPKLRRHFDSVHALAPDRTSPQEALRRPSHHLQHLARDLASRWPEFR
jgi:glycerate kinase